jgi:Na+-translocating ferredoxin:NAD+ oxidoreductase subunit G
MRNTIKMISVLTVVGLISGAALVLVYQYASPLIDNNQKNEVKSAIFKIFPETKTYEEKEIDENPYFIVKDNAGKLLGYAFIATGNGYQGEIKMMAGIESDLKTMVGIEILESQETPGLGQEISGDNFKNQFKGLTAEPEIIYIKNAKPTKPNEIEAVTGATISSRAVCSILNDTIAKIKGKIK